MILSRTGKMFIHSQFTDTNICISNYANYVIAVQNVTNVNEAPLEISLCTYDWEDITKTGHLIFNVIQIYSKSNGFYYQ